MTTIFLDYPKEDSDPTSWEGEWERLKREADFEGFDETEMESAKPDPDHEFPTSWKGPRKMKRYKFTYDFEDGYYVLYSDYMREKNAKHKEIMEYCRAIGEIESALGYAGTRPLSETVKEVKKIILKLDDATSEPKDPEK